MTSRKRHIWLALPSMAEAEFLPALIGALQEQSCRDFILVVCVNQPDSWWNDKEKVTDQEQMSHQEVCVNNRETMDLLADIGDLEIQVIDRSSPGKGWDGKDHGVGWARKTAMDRIAGLAKDDDLIVCIDGDTEVGPDYLATVRESFDSNPDALAMAVPYYHPLTGRAPEDRSVLRYELYMRHYLLNLFRIGNPYAFTAIGSAMALTVKNYKRIGGITPFKSGEDFYFLQKLAKSGKVLIHNEEWVRPAARFSNRVFFGTGPAMIKGVAGDWKSYPFYPAAAFDQVGDTYRAFPALFQHAKPTPMDDFLAKRFRSTDIWEPLRSNFKSEQQFVNACQRKVDALRILQFLKESKPVGREEDALLTYLQQHEPEIGAEFLSIGLDFERSDISVLNRLRDRLFELEMELRKKKQWAGIW